MGQENANPQGGAQSLGDLGDAFGGVEQQVTTKPRVQTRGNDGRFVAHDGDDDNEDNDETGNGNGEDDGDGDGEDEGEQTGNGTQQTAGDDGEGDDDDGGEGDDDDDGEKPKTWTIKANGQQRTLTEAEMIDAASKGLSAHDRWQKAAATQKQADDLIAACNQQRAQLNQMLQNVQSHVRAIMQADSPDLDKLAQTDPAAWVRQKHVQEQRAQHLRDAEAAQAYLASQQAQLAEIQKGQFLELQKDQVLDSIPAWRDPEKAKRGIARINTLLADAGFNAQEIANVNDSRIVRVLHAAAINADKARKYDELKSKAGAASRRVQNLPPVSEKPGNRQPQQNVKAQKRKQAIAAWDKNPNLDNLARLF